MPLHWWRPAVVGACLLATAGCATVDEQIANRIEYILPAQEASPGDVIPFSFDLPGAVKASRVVFLKKAYRVYPRLYVEGNIFTAFVPVPFLTPPGEYALHCSFRAAGAAEPIRESFPIQVLPDLQVHGEEKIRMRGFDPEALESDYRKIHAVLAEADFRNDRIEDFLLPLSGTVVSGYGDERVYNGRTRVILRGIEIEPMVAGSWDVNAAAEGRVVLAEPLKILGNTIVVDHGFSFATLYGYLESIDVDVGDVVSRGGHLGRVGRTGYAARGNRLWYQLYVSDTPVNVEKYMERNLFK